MVPLLPKVALHPELTRMRAEGKAERLFKGSVQQTERPDGFVYLNFNPIYPEWVKAGKSTDYQRRGGSYQTATPYRNCRMLAQHYRLDRGASEQAFLVHMAALGFTVDHEWVKVGKGEVFRQIAVNELKKICADQSTHGRESDV